MRCIEIPLSKGKSGAVLFAYILEGSPEYDTGKPRPAILVLPGGGYAFTNDREAEFVAMTFAARGYHAFVLRYSVGAAALMPAPVIEGFSAIALLRDRCAEWNLNPNQITVCGFSAGGHLASCLMTLWREDLFTKHLGWAPAQLRPYAGILCYALLRLPYTVSPAQTGVPAANRERLIEQLAAPLKEPQHPNWTDAIFSRDGRLCVDMAAIAYLNLFGTVKPDAATLKRYSTIDHIDGETPPAFLWTTATDEIVPASDTMDFAAGMYRNNRPVECHVFGSGEHGLSLAKTTTGYEHNHNPVGRWVAMACDWLSGLSETERGKKLPETEESLPRKKQTQKPEVPSQYYENIYQDRAGMFRHTPFALEQQLVGHVIQGDEPEALKTLGQINRQGDKAVLAANPLRSARNSIICSCTFLARAVIQAGVPVEEAFALSDSVIQHLETLREQKAVIEYEADMLVQFIRMVQKTQNKNYTVPIRKAMHYVDANLDKPLKLNDVALYAKVHPNYLSNRFRLETGNTLSGYVADRKIHEASYFVQHTDYSMAEIATLYGFSSQSYFIASFKKVMGVPPGEYRSRAGRIQ